MIHVNGLTKTFPANDGDAAPLKVLAGVDLHVAPGELVAIVGRSGSGKSTLLNAIGGLDTDYEGEVIVADRRLKSLDDAERSRFRGSTIGFVFQAFNLLAPLSALENTLLPSYFGARPQDGAPVREKAIACLDRVGLAAKAHRLPAALSGGERQRVAIARALFSSPKVVLCDEPTGNLDQVTGAEVIGLFAHLAREERLAVVIVTHEERVYRVADRVFALELGHLVQKETR